jgi:23S rRNA pseudouridine2605 synthase
MEERLQKILARTGYGSRRKCEELIVSGRVLLNGHPAGLGNKADPATDSILVDGQKLRETEKLIYVLLNKPRGILTTTSDPERRKIVRDLVPIPGTLHPVGRLDADSEGMLVLTNDGNLTNKLTHPRYEHEKEYHVMVDGFPDENQLTKWRDGMVLKDGFYTNPADVFILSKTAKGTWLRVILKEGHKRQIREMGAVSGLTVMRIIRVRVGRLLLGSLKPGEWRYLTSKEVTDLFGYSSQGDQKSVFDQKPPNHNKRNN